MACVNVSHRGLPDSEWRNILQFIPGPQQSLSLRAAQRALQIWVEEDAATIVGRRAILYDFAHVGDKFGPAFFFDSIDENMKDFLQPIARRGRATGSRDGTQISKTGPMHYRYLVLNYKFCRVTQTNTYTRPHIA